MAVPHGSTALTNPEKINTSAKITLHKATNPFLPLILQQTIYLFFLSIFFLQTLFRQFRHTTGSLSQATGYILLEILEIRSPIRLLQSGCSLFSDMAPDIPMFFSPFSAPETSTKPHRPTLTRYPLGLFHGDRVRKQVQLQSTLMGSPDPHLIRAPLYSILSTHCISDKYSYFSFTIIS